MGIWVYVRTFHNFSFCGKLKLMQCDFHMINFISVAVLQFVKCVCVDSLIAACNSCLFFVLGKDNSEKSTLRDVILGGFTNKVT